jgi:hypothetical protein
VITNLVEIIFLFETPGSTVCIKNIFVLEYRRVPNKINIERFEVFTAVTMNNGVFWDVTQCGSWKNRRFGGT